MQLTVRVDAVGIEVVERTFPEQSMPTVAQQAQPMIAVVAAHCGRLRYEQALLALNKLHAQYTLAAGKHPEALVLHILQHLQWDLFLRPLQLGKLLFALLLQQHSPTPQQDKQAASAVFKEAGHGTAVGKVPPAAVFLAIDALSRAHPQTAFAIRKQSFDTGAWRNDFNPTNEIVALAEHEQAIARAEKNVATGTLSDAMNLVGLLRALCIGGSKHVYLIAIVAAKPTKGSIPQIAFRVLHDAMNARHRQLLLRGQLMYREVLGLQSREQPYKQKHKPHTFLHCLGYKYRLQRYEIILYLHSSRRKKYEKRRSNLQGADISRRKNVSHGISAVLKECKKKVPEFLLGFWSEIER